MRVRVEIAGGDMTIDLTASRRRRGGPVNCGEAQAISACRVAYKLLVAPDLPTNGGSFARSRCRCGAGRSSGRSSPSPCPWYFSPLGLLIDLVVKALGPVLPEKAAAASYGDSMIFVAPGSTSARAGCSSTSSRRSAAGAAWEGSDGESGLINSVNAG